jgi:regulatory protein
VARFDLTDQEDPETQDDPDVTEGSAADEPAAGAETGHRVARLDGLDPATAGRARVAELDGLDAADGGRPLAPVIRLDAGEGRRAVRRRVEAEPARDVRTTDEDVARDTSRDEAGRPRRPPGSADGLPPDGFPPDGPLPRGRRKRARVGHLGPDAPDPELPLPEADPVAIAREICLRLLTDRARTRQELAQALARKGVPEEAASAVLDRFADVGLVDDAAFAGQWVRSRHTHRGLGRRAIAVELRRKGVADGDAKEALAEVDPESEDRRARELVDRKLRSMVVGTPEQRAKAAQRLVGMLARKGYGAGTAYRVVREALAEHGADADELGPGADLDG